MTNFKNQTGFVFLWLVIVVLIIIVLAGGWFYYRLKTERSQAGQNLSLNENFEEFAVPNPADPSPTPDYSQVKKQYNLNDQQVEILSRVVNDGKL